MTTLLALKSLTKVYRTDEVETTALCGVDLSIERGEFLAVMGPSGCGKSTLLNLLGMLDRPTSGSYVFGGEDVTDQPERRLTELRKRNIGFIFQSFNLVDELTVAENIELALLYQGLSAAERRARVAEVMDHVGIGHRAKHMPAQLSGGQQQRVSVARALVARPTLVLADEPTGNLDSAHGTDVMHMLQSLNDGGTTVVMVTHSPAHADYARRVIDLLDGHVVAERRTAA